jgi:hypothetical protein
MQWLTVPSAHTQYVSVLAKPCTELCTYVSVGGLLAYALKRDGRPMYEYIYMHTYCHVFLVTWLIIVGSGSDESIYWTYTSRNYSYV